MFKWISDRKKRKIKEREDKERLEVERIVKRDFNDNKDKICIHCLHEHTCKMCYTKAVGSKLGFGKLLIMMKDLEYLRKNYGV